MITLRQLRYFLAVAEHRHFGRAAEHCHVSQPALSTQIQDFEAAIGVELIERRRGNIALTPLGEAVAIRARRILGEVGDLMALTAPGRSVLNGVLRLGVIPTIAPYLLPKVLPVLATRFPSLNLVLEERRTATLLSELASGDIDVALLSLPVEDEALAQLALFEDPFLLAAPAEPVPGPAMDTLLLLDEGHCLRDQALNYCEVSDLRARRQFGLASLATVVQMVAAGYGTTLLPAMAVEREVTSRVRIHPLPGPASSRRIGLVWRKSSPRAEDFQALGEVILSARADGSLPAPSATE